MRNARCALTERSGHFSPVSTPASFILFAVPKGQPRRHRRAPVATSPEIEGRPVVPERTEFTCIATRTHTGTDIVRHTCVLDSSGGSVPSEQQEISSVRSSLSFCVSVSVSLYLSVFASVSASVSRSLSPSLSLSFNVLRNSVTKSSGCPCGTTKPYWRNIVAELMLQTHTSAIQRKRCYGSSPCPRRHNKRVWVSHTSARSKGTAQMVRLRATFCCTSPAVARRPLGQTALRATTTARINNRQRQDGL